MLTKQAEIFKIKGQLNTSETLDLQKHCMKENERRSEADACTDTGEFTWLEC